MDGAKLNAIFEVFQKGKSVVDKATWKDRQVATNAVAATIVAGTQLASITGHPLPITSEDVSTIAAVVVAFTNVALTWATSDTVGVGGANPTPPQERDTLSASQPTL